MKTYTAPLPNPRQIQITGGEKIIPVMLASIQPALALLGAIGSAAAIVLLSVWAAGMEMNARLASYSNIPDSKIPAT